MYLLCYIFNGVPAQPFSLEVVLSIVINVVVPFGTQGHWTNFQLLPHQSSNPHSNSKIQTFFIRN